MLFYKETEERLGKEPNISIRAVLYFTGKKCFCLYNILNRNDNNHTYKTFLTTLSLFFPTHVFCVLHLFLWLSCNYLYDFYLVIDCANVRIVSVGI